MESVGNMDMCRKTLDHLDVSWQDARVQIVEHLTSFSTFFLEIPRSTNIDQKRWTQVWYATVVVSLSLSLSQSLSTYWRFGYHIYSD